MDKTYVDELPEIRKFAVDLSLLGSNETAVPEAGRRLEATPEVTRRYRVQITYFFGMQIGSWRSLGVGLVASSRLCRIRHRCDSLVLPEGPGSKQWQKAAIPLRAAERNRPKMLEAAALAV